MLLYEDRLSCRFHKGTVKRIDNLRPYIAATCRNRPIPAKNLSRAQLLRELVEFALEVYERRQDAWKRENSAP